MLSRFHLIPDRQTDKRTDRFAISISRVSVLTRDKNKSDMRVCTANVTVYLIPVPDSPIQFIPPLGNNRTIVVYVKEERPLGTPVYNPVVRDVDNPATQFHFRLNSSVDGYLAVDPDTGKSMLIWQLKMLSLILLS